MNGRQILDLQVVEQRVCDVLSKQLGIPKDEIHRASRLIEDLQCDSLDILEVMMEIEDEFLITIPDDPGNAVGKSVFARHPFRVKDLAEMVYLQQGTGRPERKGLFSKKLSDFDDSKLPFSQLSGQCVVKGHELMTSLFEPLAEQDGLLQFRRLTDGMRCVLLPSAEVEIGNDSSDAQLDEKPAHTVKLDEFAVDAEPVSTTAYCRFLNSIEASQTNLRDWVLLDESDDRREQLQIELIDSTWRPVSGTETVPIVLVSWFGAAAYSLWANGAPWSEYVTHNCFLPTEAQWEHAATGAYENGLDDSSDGTNLICSQHVRGDKYAAGTMPMAPVHYPLGVSSFGLHHMAGNVWQWCADWYDGCFYQHAESRVKNPKNRSPSAVRSERGGSWVGPGELCRGSYRRGRAPTARGRCLGFRCVSPIEALPTS